MYRGRDFRTGRAHRRRPILPFGLWAGVAMFLSFGAGVSVMRSFRSGEPASSVYGATRFSAERKPEPRSGMVSNLTRETGPAPPEIEESSGGAFSVDGGFGGRHTRPLNTTFLSTRVSGNSNTGRNERGSRKGMSIARSHTGGTRRPGPIERDLSTQ